MSCTFSIQSECLRLPLRAGSELSCHSGTLWLTFESRGRRSPDVLLAPGERFRLAGERGVHIVYVAALYGAGPAICRIDGPDSRARTGLARAWPAWRARLGLSAAAGR